MDFDTLVSLFHTQAEQQPESAAISHKSHGAWIDTTWQSLLDHTSHAASGLLELGVGAGDRVAILSENSPKWITADLATMSIGAISVALYAPLPAPQVREQLPGCKPFS